MSRKPDLTVGLGDSNEEIGRRVRSFLQEQSIESLELSLTMQSDQSVSAPALRSSPALTGRVTSKKLATSATEGALPERTAVGRVASSAGSLESAMDRARVRGEERVAEILSRPEMLSGEEFGRRIGISRQAVDKRRNASDLIGLEGPSRGVRYPAWQVTGEGHMLPGLGGVLELTGEDPWVAYRVLVEEFPDGSGDQVYQKLSRGEIDLVLAHVDAVMAGAPT